MPAQSARRDLDAKAERYSTASGMTRVMQCHLNEIGRDNCSACPTCKRAITTDVERQQIMTAVEMDLQNWPEQLQQLRSDLDSTRTRYDTLLALQPQWLRLRDLRAQVAPIAAAAEGEAAHAQELAAQVHEQEEEVATCEAEINEFSKVVSEGAWQVDSKHRDVEEARAQVAQLSSLLGSQANARSVADVDRELSEHEAARADAERRRDDAVRAHVQLKEAVVLIGGDLGAARAELVRIRESIVKRDELHAKVRDLTEQNRQLFESSAAAAALQAPREARRAQLTGERNAAVAQGAAREADAERRLRDVRQLGDQLASKSDPVRAYVRANRAGELARVEAEIARLQQRSEGMAASIAALEAEIVDAQRAGAEHECMRRDTQDVLEYRRARAQLVAARQKLEEHRAALAGVGSQRALERQRDELQESMDTLLCSAENHRGQLAVTEQAGARAKSELRAPQYTLISAKYNEMRLKLRSTELANQDLEAYHKALEKALLAYHTSKMADINKIIKELWQKTYRGQDIDYIQIKADTEGIGARSYNYRVVMHNGGAELEMRGRCSAGQKVLACLIIRLALAEAFCLNCGILALDEPTTNLDAENAASLAEALRQIMTARRGQAGFQLIVITHDEAFAHLIGTRDNTELLWRITKDDGQHTSIQPEEVE